MARILDSIDGPADLKKLDHAALRTLAQEIRDELVATVSKTGGHLSPNLGTVELTLALHTVFDSPRDKIVWDAGHLDTQLIVVLNDNGMSIAPNVGAISRVLTRFRTDRRYIEAKEEVWKGLAHVPLGEHMRQAAKRAKKSVKDFMFFTMFWEEMGFTYLGPIDGHDIEAVQETLRAANSLSRPVLLHVVTAKGKGWNPAEEDNEKYHGISAVGAKKPAAPAYGAVFAETLCTLAESDPRIVAITAAMPSGTNLNKFGARFPERFFDVGIAESHAVTFAAGLATQGLKPVCAIYSTFLQRAYDQIIHDVCAQNLDVTFAVANAGLVGDDGRTHQGAFDVSYLRCVPDLVVMAPKDENELRRMIVTAVAADGPAAS